MPTYFADTCFWIALINPRDQLRAQAEELDERVQKEGARLVTTDMVFAEVYNYFSKITRLRKPTDSLVRSLRANPNVLTVRQTALQFELGADEFAKYEDKEWSLTDCVSFIEMRTRGITEALTSDHHFQQAGFVCLMTSP